MQNGSLIVVQRKKQTGKLPEPFFQLALHRPGAFSGVTSMFGPGGMGAYRRMKEQADKAPHVEVPEAEFIRLAIASGMSEEKAKQTATISKIMGSSVLIGGQMLNIKDEESK
jgi:hypothetical protein